MPRICAIYNIVSTEKEDTEHPKEEWLRQLPRMNETDRIQELIEELRRLRVKESAILQEVERLNKRRGTATQNSRSTQQREDSKGKYRVGDRVFVTNQIRRPILAPRHWTLDNERKGTVTGIGKERIYYRTDNGTETWRLTKNLRPLQH